MSTEPTGYKKKLIEVALPLDEINKQSAREKSIRHGHPSTLHLWWARRPLAACRAVLFAQLVDDPSSRPDEFPTEEDQALERKRLFTIIERLVNWDNINDKALYEEARKEIWKSCDGNPPPILDPFAGGGSIPLEAQRLGLEAHASDLNPVPVLINKALIEIPPKWTGMPPVFPGAAEERLGDWPGATGLAEDVRRYGQWMRDEAEKRIGHHYPKAKLEDGTEANVIAWIWARTVTCPNPTCGATMPLVKSFWLGKRKGRERYVEPIIEGKRIRFEIRGPKGTPREGTIGRTSAVCLICGDPVTLARIRTEGKAGRLGTQLMAIAAEGKRQRHYVAPTSEHEMAAGVARPDDVPDGEISTNPRWFSPPLFGMTEFGDLFTNRQVVALTTISVLIAEVRDRVILDAKDSKVFDTDLNRDSWNAYADSISLFMGFLFSAIIDDLSSLVGWRSSHGSGATRSTFSRQALQMTWDFAESCPFSGAAGDLDAAIKAVSSALLALPGGRKPGRVEQADAQVRDYQSVLVATDPPYYDNITYGDLSDFFYIWLRRSLRSVFPKELGTLLTPKADELIANPHRQGSRDQATHYFEAGFQKVFMRIQENATLEYPMTVFYAFKQSESDDRGEASTGWETLLEGMIQAGWMVTSTWPIRTEKTGRMLSIGTNALASSVVLSCRPRPDHTAGLDRRGLISALKAELPAALRELQQGGVAPVDLAQAAIGPGMAVFSRYSRVTESDGTPMGVRAALVLINQVLAEVLSEQEGDFDPDTRFCIKWFESYSFDLAKRKYGEAETLSKAMDTSVAGLNRAGVLQARAGDVQLLSPAEMPDNYDPVTDDRISIWEVVMHLAKLLSKDGIDASARLMAGSKSRIDLDTAKELTYLLYSVCERRKWAETGRLFNELGAAWPEIDKVARTAAPIGDVQGTFDYPKED